MDGGVDGRGAPAPGRRAFAPPLRIAAPPPAVLPLLLIVVSLFGLSGGMLWHLGYNYDGLSGGVVTKIHPSTYLIFALFLWNGCKQGNPVGYAVRGAWLYPGGLLLIVAALAMFIHIVTRAAPGMAGAIDTFLPPPLIAVMLLDLDERGMARIETALHALMTANAVMALVEFVIRIRFFPYRFDGAIFPFDTRSSALGGHPLVNAAMTAWYALALLNGCRSLPQAWRLPLFGVQLAALVAFGGRTAMVLTIVLGGLYLASLAHRALRAGRVPILGAAAVLMLVALVPVGIGALAAGGFFDALITRFVSDGGSANARVEMFTLFDNLPFRDLLVGPDTGLIESLRRVNGLEWGIENPLIKTLLYQGLLITVLMTVAITVFLFEVARFCARGVWLPMLVFVLLLNTSESIAGKTTLLTKFVVTILCLYRPVRARLIAAGPTIQVRR